MFSSDADLQRADWPMLQNGAVNLFHSRKLWTGAQQGLAELGYELATVSCRQGYDVFRQQISDALQWKMQFGYEPWTGNLDALNDALRRFPFGSSGRSALVLDGFHEIVWADAGRAHAILDIVERGARDQLLWGKTLVALIQTDDPDYECSKIGCRSANWNSKEWINDRRGR